jgi:PAS domain S-box-containing protein
MPSIPLFRNQQFTRLHHAQSTYENPFTLCAVLNLIMSAFSEGILVVHWRLQEQSENMSSRLILAVDDENSGLYFRRLMLEHAGYKVLSATGVDEALGLFANSPIDLVVTDHLLGRHVGTEMARQMKALKPSVPIILLSGTTSVPEPLEHADAFLNKNEGPDQLLQKIKQLLSDRSASASLSQPDESVDNSQLHSLLAAIVENSDDAIFSKNLNGRVLTWNKAAERMYGYSAEAIIGQDVTVLLPPERSNEVQELLEKLRAGERIEHFETTRRRRDGKILNVSLTISPVRDAQGNMVAASTIARDITQTKIAEEAIRTSEKFAVAGRMAATIAHEINNPLESISNIHYLLRHNKSLNDDARKYLEAADEELRRIGQITRTTLGFYRERDTSVVQINLTEMLDSILLLYKRRLESLGVTVEKHFESAAIVRGVPGELRQVFSNLIVNAMDALGVCGTKLVLRVRNSRQWTDSNREGIRVSICDDASGMPKEVQSNLFHPFFTTKGRDGTGVGLWVSRGIIAKHSGSINVRSSTGNIHGTCFSVFLPR